MWKENKARGTDWKLKDGKGQEEEKIGMLDGVWKRSRSLFSIENIWVKTHRWKRGWNVPGREISPEWLVH